MKTNPALKVLAFLLCMVSAAAAFWSGLISLIYWDDIWTQANYYTSQNYLECCFTMEHRVQELAQLEELKKTAGLTYSMEERLEALRAALDPNNTNYRYELRRDDTGELVSSNLGAGPLLEDVANGIELGVFSVSRNTQLHDLDERYSEHYMAIVHVLRVWTGTEYLEFRSDQEPVGYNAYGWYNNGENWHSYDSDQDCRVTVTDYALRAGVLRDFPVDDIFLNGYNTYFSWHQNLPLAGAAALVSLSVFFITLAYLLYSAGHRPDVEGICLSWPERIPLDVYAAAVVLFLLAGSSLSDPITSGLNLQVRTYRIVGLLAVTAAVAAAVLGFLLTLAVRVKAHIFLQSILTWRICVWCFHTLGKGARAIGQGVNELLHTLSMNVRLGLAYLVYLGINAFLALEFFRGYSSGFYFIGLILFNGGVFLLACRWINQWRAIRESTGRIVGGETNVQIDTSRMYPDLKAHAGQLNDLGTAIDHAVDERLRSEHFKAELITNVSHDLKTPLTSIINYVDLLKKLDIDDPKAQEYLEVLDRKGQRLKKLTEDLVEASKASTGNITVNPVHMDLVEFTQQAAAEYEDRLLQQHLTLITKMADHPVYISADGRHMWRILDNLLGNCAKYAMEGTRIYLEVMEWDGKASISLKNISRDPLVGDPDHLTERFVRGDESRTADGSGLGLSIARSLTEVQGGTFRLSTDGDLFKAAVYFPLALEESDNKQIS